MSATDDLRHSLALLNHQFASLESLNLWTLPSSSTLTNKPTIEETRDENETLARHDLPTIIASHSSKDQLAFTSPTSPLRERSQTSSSSAAGSVWAGTMSPTITALEFGNDMLWDALGLEREDLESEENHKSEERLDNVGKAMSAGSLSPTPTSNDLFNFADFPSFSSVSDISLKSKDTGDEEDQRRSQALLSFPLPPSPVQQSKPVITADATPVEDAEINEREKEASVTEMPKNETQRSVLGLGITTEPVDMRQNSQKRYVSGSESRSPTRSDSSESIEALAEESKPVIAEPRGRTGRPRLSHRDQLDRIPSFIGSVGTLEPPSPVKANFSSSQRMSSSAPSSPTVRTFGLSTGVSPPKPVVWGANTSRLSLTESGIPALQFGNAAADYYYAQRMSALTQKMEKLKKKKSEPTLRGPRASESPSPISSPTLSRPPMPTRISSAPPSTSPRISAPRSPLGGPRSPLSNNFVAATEPEILKDDKPVQQVKRRSSRFSLNNLRFSSKKSPSLKSPPLPVSSSALPPQESQPSTSKAVKKKASLSSLASKASAKISGSSPRAPSFRSHKDSIALKSPVPTIQPVHVGRSTSRGHSPPPSPALSSLPSPAFSESSFRPPMPPLPSPSLRPPAQPSSPRLPGSPVFPTIKQAVEAHSSQQPMQVMTRSNTSCFIEQLDDDVEPFPLRQGSSSKASPIPEPVELREPDTKDGKVESSPDVADAEEEVDSRGPSLSIETEGSESSIEAHVMTASKVTSPRLAPASLPPVTVSASPPTIDYFSPFDPSMSLLDTSTGSGSRPSTPLSPTFGVELVNRPRRGSSIMQSAIMPDSMPMASSPAESASLSHESFERVGSPEVEEVISFPFPDNKLEAPSMSRKNSNADSTSRSELAFSTTDTRDSQSSNGHDDSGWNNDTTDVTSVEESSSSHGHASKQSNESADQQFVEASAGPESETDALEDAPEEKEEADEAVPLAQAIPGAVAVQESLRAEVGSVVSGGGDKSDPFEFSEHLREASSGTSRALTPEPVGHSMLPQTDDAVERKRPLLKSPSQPLDPVIAESTLMISDSPPLARIDLQETSTANRSRSSSASEGSRPKPALRIDVNAMPRSWTASGPSKALLSPASAVTTSSSHSHAPRAPSPTRAPSKAAPQVSAIPASPRFPSPLSSRGHEDSSSQRKIYIVDSQKHFIANMGPKTRCGDVVDLARSKNLLTEGTDAEGGWALWELCRDAGLERPCREYEILTDVLSSWGQEKNTLLIRRTLIWPILSACLRPQPLMTKNEQVHIELKTGKWVKRNIIVEDGVISLSKSGKAKDATVLCKLNTFDAFFVSPGASRRSNAPRPCLFALKSSVARHQYEDESDYCYYVAVKSNDEVTSWIKSIIEARNDFLRKREVEVLGQTSLPKTVSNWQTLLSPVGPPASSSSPSTSPPSMTAPSAKSAPASVAAPVSSRMPMPAQPRTTSSPMVAQSATGARSSSRARSNSQPAPKTSRAPMPPGIGPPPIPLPSLFNRQQQQPSKGVSAARMPLQPQPANIGGARSTTFANATTPSGLDKFAPTAGAAIRMQQMQQQQTLLDRRDVELRLRAHQIRQPSYR